MSLEFKLSIAKTLIQQKIYRNRLSWPYLSGDAFSSLADFSFYSSFRDNPSSSSVSDAKVIFCPGDRLEEMFDSYNKVITAKVLILGNSDEDFIFRPDGIPFSVRHTFAQNLSASSADMTVLPIGLENLRLARNGFPSLVQDDESKPKKTEILLGPFGMTHPERNFPEELRSSKPGVWCVMEGPLSPRQYAHAASSFSYIAAPRGNGIDTHRFWESLYRGATPVVRRTNWSSNVKSLGIPLVEVDEWNGDAIEDLLNQSPSHPRIAAKQVPALWMNYWERLVASYI